jgi:DNA-binding beta-propeller fold protein YncE
MKSKACIFLSVFMIFNMTSSTESEASLWSEIYYTDSNNGGQAIAKVWKVNIDGKNSLPLVPAGLNPRYIALDLVDNKMYWTDIGGILRADLDGNNLEFFIAGLPGAIGLALDRESYKIYWTDVATNMIQRANLDGTGIENIVVELGEPRALALDYIAGKVYWTDTLTEKLQRANFDGSEIEDLVTGQPFPQGIALNVQEDTMYWLSSDSYMWSARLDGTEAQPVFFSGQSIGIALDIEGGKIYWTNFGSKKVQRANFDGSDTEDLVSSDLDTPWGIALAIFPALEVAIDLRPGNQQNIVNLKSSGVVPVAIISSDIFDALTVKEETILLSGAAVRSPGKSNEYMCQERDVNMDGLIDLVCNFDNRDLRLKEGAEIVELKAETEDGSKIKGTDYVRIVP